jgi:glycosyltransferase involved in cell wall biosynthesis
MTHRTNAAIWFSADGYDPATKGINGRRVVGESFLRGFFAHAEVDEFISISRYSSDDAAFRAFAADCGVTRAVRGVRLDTPEALAPTEVLYYAAPNFASECWRRAPHGAAAWAITGITHTIASTSVMQGLFDLRAAPQMPWDALICTSRAAQASLRTAMELAEAHLALRFPGAVLPARPLLPVIPLGIHCDDFVRDPVAGQGLRTRLGIAPGDIAVACIARLTPQEKFDPLPLFIAMEAASAELLGKGGGKLHALFYGKFSDAVWRDVFVASAAALMPSVGFHLLDGAIARDHKATLSGAEIFVFPIDNVQETFGLAPIEAMAAGLPVIVSDWDGMKDTVTPDVGFRIPTEVPEAGLTTHLGLRHFGGTDSFQQYLGQLAALTRIDVPALIRALVTLCSDADLRAQMGAAGRARARAVYDWSVVIPQMQALWAEQAAMLEHARRSPDHRRALAPLDAAHLPVAPAPHLYLASFPSTLPAGPRRYRAVALGARPDLAATLTLRNYAATRRMFEDPVRVAAVLTALTDAGPAGATAADLARVTRLPIRLVGRVLVWLLKYHFAEDIP